MKTKIIFISVAVFLYAFFHIPTTQAQTPPSPIRINEIAWMGIIGNSNGEWIELYNDGSAKNITGWSIIAGDNTPTIHLSGDIPSQGFFLLERTSDNTLPDISANLIYTGALEDGGETLVLKNDRGETIQTVDASGGWPAGDKTTKNTMQRTSSGWQSAPPSPKATNAESVATVAAPSTVRFNEILPNPSGDDGTNEFIELFNYGSEEIDVHGWHISDPTKSAPIEGKIPPLGYRTFLKTVSLNNTDETLSLFDDSDTLIDSVYYKTTKEGVSLNYTATGWRGGTPTPDAINQLNNLPETKEKVPKVGYHGMAVDFDARGEDSDRDTLKYTWDFGDDHKSYKEKTTHTYEDNGTYTVTLKTSDSKEDVIETFMIEIQSYKAPEVRITSLMANPAGSDTGNEWIIIENREKKTVNLKNFSIATGWKTLSNHPVNTDFLIKPKAEVKLTHNFSLFTLPNQKGKIELRAPDGKVLQSIKYKLDKPVAENAVYRKEKGSAWKWEMLIKQIPTATGKEMNKEETASPTREIPETKPEEIIQPTGEEAPIEAIETKHDQLSLDPNRPKPQELLAYGTHAHLQDTITLAPPVPKEIVLFPETKNDPLSFPERLASSINASLNRLLNGSQEK